MHHTTFIVVWCIRKTEVTDMSKQTEYRKPAPGTALNPDEFQHELTQIYLELKDSFTRARLRKNHPAPKVPESHLNPNVMWKSSDVKLKAFSAPKARLAKIAEVNPELTTDRVIAPPEIREAKISKREWNMKKQSVPALPRTVANTKWETIDPKWSRPVPPKVTSAKISSAAQTRTDLSKVKPPKKIKVNVKWEVQKLNLTEPKPVTGPVTAKNTSFSEFALNIKKKPGTVAVTTAKNTSFSEFKLNLKKKPGPVAVVTAKTGKKVEFTPGKAYDRPAMPSPAKITEVQKNSPQIGTIAPVSVRRASVRNVSISTAPVNIVPVGCSVAKITPAAAVQPKIDNPKQISVRYAHVQKMDMRDLGMVPAVQIAVPDVSEVNKPIALITPNISGCRINAVMASTQLYETELAEPARMSVDTHLASTEIPDFSVPLPITQEVPMISANIPAQIDLLPNGQRIPEISVTIYKNPEAPDLGLPKIREIQPAVQPTFMDAMAVWESMGGPEAFARDGFVLNHTKR